MDHALSLTSQPNIEDLLCRLGEARAEGQPLAIICGAGVSADAGLPGWSELVKRMCEGVTEAPFAEVLKADPIDDRRKIDYVIRMLDEGKTSLTDLLQQCLYRDLSSYSPGNLADSVARLCWTWGFKSAVLTTNFDDQLEKALEVYEVTSRSYPLYDDVETRHMCTKFEDSLENDDEAGVLHLHGMVAPGKPILPPVILSESYFLRYGADIRTKISQHITNGTTLFVGLSLADPNVVGPLSDLAQSPNTFVIFAPDHIEGFGSEVLYEYARKRAEFFEEDFGIKSILLKSYSQVSQLLYECSLYLADEKRYLSNSRKKSTKYGLRYQRHLAQAYEHLGTSKTSRFNPTLSHAKTISDKLHHELHGDDGVLVALDKMKRKVPDFRLFEAGINRRTLASEYFALFLWLRVRAIDSEDDPTPYALQFVGSSAYAHRSIDSYPEPILVQPGTGYPAVDAAFSGRLEHANFSDQGRTRVVWRSSLATPILMAGLEDYDTTVQVGSITLNSDRRRLLNERSGQESFTLAAGPPSLLAFLDNRQLETIAERLQISASRLVGAT